MKVVTKQTLMFRVPGHQDFILRPSQHPVNAPDYIRDTQLFKLAASDKTLEEFIPAPVAPPVDAAKKAAEAKAQADADAAKKVAEEKAAAEAKAKAEADAKAQADADAAKNAAEEKVKAEIEAAKEALAKNDKKGK